MDSSDFWEERTCFRGKGLSLRDYPSKAEIRSLSLVRFRSWVFYLMLILKILLFV